MNVYDRRGNFSAHENRARPLISELTQRERPEAKGGEALDRGVEDERIALASRRHLGGRRANEEGEDTTVSTKIPWGCHEGSSCIVPVLQVGDGFLTARRIRRLSFYVSEAKEDFPPS